MARYMAISEIMIRGNKEHGFYPVLNDNAIPNCFYQNYVNQRWLGGILTNWFTIKTRVERLKDLEQKDESGAD